MRCLIVDEGDKGRHMQVVDSGNKSGGPVVKELVGLGTEDGNDSWMYIGEMSEK